MKNRKGVSEIVASMIILVVTASLGAILYNFALSSTNSQTNSLTYETNSQEDISRERLTILSVSVTDENKMNITVINYGKIDVNITDAYIKYNNDPIQHLAISNGDLYILTLKSIYSDFNCQNSGEYQIELVSQRGVQYAYTWKK